MRQTGEGEIERREMSETKQIDDGGPAFPVADISKTQCPGLSVRDWFARQAMSLSGCDIRYMSDDELNLSAQRCWYYADAMLKARAER
jgi:hypothetical protein